MFLKFVCLCCVAACVLAAPSPTNVVPLEKQQPTVIPIVSQSEELESNGTYKFSYETGNGIKREETSYDKILPKAQGRSSHSGEESDSDESDEIHVQQGSYSYTAPDGTLISVRYIADENGFRPIGSHIPTVSPLAQEIQAKANAKSGRALNADNAESESAPAPAAASKPAAVPAPEKPKSEEAPVKVKSRVGSDEPAAEASTTGAAPQEPASEATTAEEPASSTAAAEQSTTAEAASTSEQPTTESASSAAPEESSSEATSVASTESPSTPEPTSEATSTSAPEEPTSEQASTTPAEASSTAAQSSFEVSTTEAASPTTVSA